MFVCDVAKFSRTKQIALKKQNPRVTGDNKSRIEKLKAHLRSSVQG